jgi:hypothetical protein
MTSHKDALHNNKGLLYDSHFLKTALDTETESRYLTIFKKPYLKVLNCK